MAGMVEATQHERGEGVLVKQQNQQQLEDTAVKQPKRLARKQVDAPVTAQEEQRVEGTVNIWTGRPAKGFGRSREERQKKVASAYRCHPIVDEGWTRGEGSSVPYCCLYFARGICHHGADCNYLHRVPTMEMELRHRTDYGHDIFGRERVSEEMDRRKKGVGSYERECKTLYVHYGGAGTLPALTLRKVVEDNFKEWGPVEDIHIVPLKTLAFVRYEWRSSAEFAKAAMHQQTLRGTDTTEVLDVRWANDDPNPRAIARVQREREEAFRDAYARAVNEMAPEAKRARLQQLHLQATVRPGAAAAAYPDTDAQYGRHGGGSSGSGGDLWRGGGAAAGSGGYTHQYQGWDAFHAAQAEQQQQGGGGSAAGVVPDDEGGVEQQWAAYAAWQAQHQHQYPSVMGGQLGAEDGYERYLRPQDWASLAAPGEAGGGCQQPDQEERQQQHQQQQLDADKAAEEALGLIGGYGSDSGEDS